MVVTIKAHISAHEMSHLRQKNGAYKQATKMKVALNRANRRLSKQAIHIDPEVLISETYVR